MQLLIVSFTTQNFKKRITKESQNSKECMSDKAIDIRWVDTHRVCKSAFEGQGLVLLLQKLYTFLNDGWFCRIGRNIININFILLFNIAADAVRIRPKLYVQCQLLVDLVQRQFESKTASFIIFTNQIKV